MTDKEKGRVLTIRNVPSEVDEAIAAQARAFGRSKSEFVQEFLSATFGDPIGNFIRTSELVALMDREMAKVTDLPLSDAWTDGGMTLSESREFCRLLGILSADDLQRIMMAAVPWLHLRARQLDVDIPLLPQGVSLSYALFIEAAGLDYQTLLPLRRSLYFMTDEARFWQQVDEMREARKLPPLDRPQF
ncbi:hypothetical protein FS594_28765 (plasmid) [Rahnella aquatilis]|nr:hypothetical protein FS594_28765 [Rahnella aquatilis]